MTRSYAHRRRRAAVIKATLLVAAGVVLFAPKLEDLWIPDIGSFGPAPLIAAVQAGESGVAKPKNRAPLPPV